LGSQIGCDWRELKSLAEHAGMHYDSFDVQKEGKPQAEWRHLDVPRARLMQVQRQIARFLRLRVSLPETMQGGIRGRSARTNAGVHLGQKTVFKLDIRDCFPSVGPRRVFQVFREVLCFSDEISRVLTKLTTYHRRLPQGAPTSTLLANLAMLPLHDAIQDVCKEFSIRCSFFIDDITVSGGGARDAAGRIVELVRRHGFAMRARKVCLLSSHRDAQKITGVQINGGRFSVGRARKNQLRRRIFLVARSSPVLDSELRSIRSSISQVEHVSPVQGAALLRLAKAQLPEHGIVTEDSRASSRLCRCVSAKKHRRQHNKRLSAQATRACGG
jgi:RNA-directed DNA polymerase